MPIYMLRCADGRFYVGSTRSSLERRIAEHQNGHYGGFTAARRPVELVWSQYFERIDDAVAVERQLKGWSRAKKQAFIAGDWPRVRSLAKRRGSSFETRPAGAPQDEGGR